MNSGLILGLLVIGGISALPYMPKYFPTSRIRVATHKDLDAIARIYNQAIISGTATFDSIAVDKSRFEQYLKPEGHSKSILLVAIDSDKVVGWASISPVSSRWAYRATAVVSTYVDKDFQGFGIGSALKYSLFEWCKKAGYHSIIGEVLSTNVKSILINMKLGFHIVGVIREAGFRDNNWIDLIVMQKMISNTNIQERQLRLSIITTNIEKTVHLYRDILGLQMRPLSNAIAMFPLGYAELEVCHNLSTEKLLGVKIDSKPKGLLITISKSERVIERVRKDTIEFGVTSLETSVDGAWSFIDFNGVTWLIERG